MEETIGYEALFSPEEWDAIQTGDWSDGPEENWGQGHAGGPRKKHRVTITVVDDGYELTCECCELFEHVSDVTEADNRKLLHEEFIAVVVDRWSVNR